MTGKEAIEALERGQMISLPEWNVDCGVYKDISKTPIECEYCILSTKELGWKRSSILMRNNWILHLRPSPVAADFVEVEEEYVYKRKSLLNWRKENE